MQGNAGETVVLVAEDEALLLFAISDELRDAGFTVLEASDGSAALKLMETTGRVDVLFTDVAMPGYIDGLALARTVAERWPATRLIVTSGHVDMKQADVPAGGRFLPKPYSPAVAIGAVREARG